ncbi:carbohydrate kinase family protein [Campylobacter aviculae]|uniref:Carbohydrate kinase n=1 Tax=Campylobacter aviculae TaxID=2510190 RepID=A0A4U7BJB2_9BACT|nr:PfkB family carbohydrate kinase [Campylobacter aviculae]TKX31659.1 carbohydrate kinase [Campylobacter aviculae]
MKVLVFGEILYDVYGDKYSIGGGPFNFAIWLSRMIGKKEALTMISALGNDELGLKALEFAKKEQINTSCIELSSKFPTSKALVFLNEDKIPDYIIEEGIAWDNIIFNEQISKSLDFDYDIFYFNLLAQRFDASANTLKKIMDKVKAKFKVFDMTLRKNYFTKEKLSDALNFINVLKVNEEELELVKKLFYPDFKSDIKQILTLIQKDFNIPYIFLTLGEKGSCLQSLNGFFTKDARKDIKIVDTVGAGDSFCAALSYALVKNLKEEEILSFATEIAENVIQLQGGTTFFDFYHIQKKYF